MFKLFVVLIVLLINFFTFSARAHSPDQNYHRDFWNPTYHIQRLNYCLMDDNKACGIKVANRFCHLMGYEGADREVIEYNVGYTHYLGTKSACKGWRCNGFKVIRCVNQIVHKPAASYYYRSKQFVLPRLSHYRIDWCLEKNKHCGKPAANSFCKRMGYDKAISFKKGTNVPLTKTLGSQALCVNQNCSGFSELTCHR